MNQYHITYIHSDGVVVSATLAASSSASACGVIESTGALVLSCVKFDI